MLRAVGGKDRHRITATATHSGSGSSSGDAQRNSRKVGGGRGEGNEPNVWGLDAKEYVVEGDEERDLRVRLGR